MANVFDEALAKPKANVFDDPGAYATAQKSASSKSAKLAKKTGTQERTLGEKASDTVKGVAAFAAKTGLSGAEMIADTTSFVGGAIGSEQLQQSSKITKELIEKGQQAEWLQPSPAWQQASNEGNIGKLLSPGLLGETISNIAPSVVSSIGLFMVNPAVGLTASAGSVGDEIRNLALDKGMSGPAATALGLGTGLVIGLVDKIVPDEILSTKAKGDLAKSLMGRLSGIVKTGGREAITELGQEEIQVLVEKTLRDDLGVNEEATRYVLSALGGGMGGAGAKTISSIFTGTQKMAEKPEAPSVPRETVVTETTPKPPDSIQFVQKAKSDARPLMEQMSDLERFQRGVDSTTLSSLSIGDPANPSTGSAFEVDNALFVTRDVGTDGTVVGYKIPLDGTPNVEMTSVQSSQLQAVQSDLASIRQAIETSQIPTVRRSEQFITQQEAVATIRRYFNDEELDVSFVEKINTPEGGAAFGRYTPGMITFINNPHKTTPDHETVHAYLDLFYQPGQKEAVYAEARKQAGVDMGDVDTEEWVADRFVRYARERSGVSGRLKEFFERVLNFLRRAFKRTNPDAVAQLFEDIRTKKRPVNPPAEQNVQEEYFQQPEKLTAKFFTLPEISERVFASRQFISDLMKSGKANLKQAERLLLEDVLNTQFKPDTTPSGQVIYRGDREPISLLSFDLERMKNVKEIGARFANTPGIYFTDSQQDAQVYGQNITKVSIAKTANFIDGLSKKLLPRKKIEEIAKNLGEFDGVSYLDSAATDWSPNMNEGRKLVIDAVMDADNVRDQIAGIFADILHHQDPNVFIKAMSTSGIDGIYLDTGVAEGITHYVAYNPAALVSQTATNPSDKIDIQAFKKAVEAELLPLERGMEEIANLGGPEAKDPNADDYFDTPSTQYEGVVLPADLRGEVESYAEHVYSSPIKTSAGSVHFHGEKNYFAHTRTEDMADGYTRRLIEVQSDLFQKGRLEQDAAKLVNRMTNTERKEYDKLDTFRSNGDGTLEQRDAAWKRMEELRNEAEKRSGVPNPKLTQYSQTWWQRILREEIRQAAVREKKVLLVPTGETAMMVEGLTGRSSGLVLDDASPVREIAAGALVTRRQDNSSWLVLERNGTTVRAVSWDQITRKNPDLNIEEESKNLGKYETGVPTEEFSVSASNADPNNPIFKFYERDVVPYMEKLRRGNTERITDENGVTWLKTAITQEDLGPVLAYQRVPETPDDEYRTLEETGHIPTPDATLNARETVAAYQVDDVMGPQPAPNSLQSGKSAELDYRLLVALETFQQAELEQEEAKQYAISQLESDSKFYDPTMDDNYATFAKLAKRRPWMLDPGTDAAKVKSEIEDSKNLFENGLGLTDDETLLQFQERVGVEKDLLDVAKKKTPAELRAIAKKSAEKYVRDNSFRAQARIKTVIDRINVKLPQTKITLDESKVLRMRLQAMALGSKIGLKEGQKIMKDELIAKWKQSESDRMEVVNEVADYMSENLPTAQRGRFVKALAKIKDVKQAWKIMDQIDRISDQQAKADAVAEFKDLTKHIKNGNIALEYAERINAIVSSLDQSKPTQATMRRLLSLADYVERNGQRAVPAGTSAQLRRLAKKPIADLTASDIEEINNEIKRLARMGKLKMELQNIYDERVWQKNLTDLLSTTVNRDPNTGNPKKDQRIFAAKRSTELLSVPMRIFDTMDGFAGYEGPNATLAKKITLSDEKASLARELRMQRVLTELAEAGAKDISEEQQLVIQMHLAMEQGQEAAVGATLEKNGIKALRELTEQERRVLEILRKEAGGRTNAIAAVFEEQNNLRFPAVANYYPLKYDGEPDMSAEEAVIQERMRRAGTEKGFTQQRVPQVKKPLRGDLFGVLFQAIAEQERYIHLEPVIRDVSSLVKSKEYREGAGKLNSNFWSSQLDIVSRGGLSADAVKLGMIDPFMRRARYNVSSAILGGRLTTVLLQPFALVNTYGYLTQRFGFIKASTLFTEATKTFFNPRYMERVKKESPSLSLREGGDATVEELNKQIDAMDGGDSAIEKVRNFLTRVALKPMKHFDMVAAAATDQSMYKLLRAQGVPDAEARKEADFVMNMLSASSELMYKPQMYSLGEGARLFMMFMSYPLNEWGFVTHDIVRGGMIRGDWSDKFRAALALSFVFMGRAASEFVRTLVSNQFKDEDAQREVEPVSLMAGSTVGMVPFFGPAIMGMVNGYESELIGSPVLDAIQGVAVQPVKAALSSKEETQMKALIKSLESAVTLAGIPILPLLLSSARTLLIK